MAQLYGGNVEAADSREYGRAKLQEYEQHGWAKQVERRWRLTPEGFLLSNRLIGELLELQEGATLANTLEKIDQIPVNRKKCDRIRRKLTV